MFFDYIHAFLPYGTASVNTTKLPDDNPVEIVELLFHPLNARTHHECWEALLVDAYCISYDGEINIGYLEDVFVEVAFKYTLPTVVSRLLRQPARSLTGLSYSQRLCVCEDTLPLLDHRIQGE